MLLDVTALSLALVAATHTATAQDDSCLLSCQQFIPPGDRNTAKCDVDCMCSGNTSTIQLLGDCLQCLNEHPDLRQYVFKLDDFDTMQDVNNFCANRTQSAVSGSGFTRSDGPTAAQAYTALASFAFISLGLAILL